MNKLSLKRIYLYFFSALGLILVIIAGVRLVNLTLKTFIFTEADRFYSYPVAPLRDNETKVDQPNEEDIEEFEEKQRRAQRQRDMSDSIAMIVIGFPLYVYHWREVKKLYNTEKE